MTGSGVGQLYVELLGRERECAAIDRLLAAARADHSGALVVRGEAGIGKSALLEYAARQAAQDTTVLRVGGVEAESDLPFAGLHGLLRPIFSYLEELPLTQRDALAGALGLGPSLAPDRLLISAAVIGLLATAAEERPVLCLVDDAQWLDQPSAEALVFAARRLQAERLAVVFGARDGEERQFDAAGLPELRLAGLAPESAASVLRGHARAAIPSVRERLMAEADGNPLALLELPAALTEAQLDGRVPLPDAIPLSPRLEEVFRQRAARLPHAAQTALLAAAADTSGDVSAVLRAAAWLGLPPDTLDPAEEVGLIRISGRTISFRHPLVRSALYQGATMSQRQRVHHALAGALPAFERARTELLYGEWLRRERQRTAARTHLRIACDVFQSLRATPWADRAEAELRATGETARKRDESAVVQLTPQEIQIAGMVAEGLTNKEIAAQLYLSPRTVDYHLHKVFAKLGIASRTDLVRHGLPGVTQPA